MHYYKHHIGDFRSGTSNMKPLERWLYRDMLDVSYDKEQPLPLDPKLVCEAIGAEGPEQIAAVEKILRLKFIKTEAGWVNERCQTELASYHAGAEVARENGKKGGRPPKNNPAGSRRDADGNPMGTGKEPNGNQKQTGSQANHKPVTSNHKPEPKKAEARGSRLPEDWHPSEEDTAFCKAERPDLRPSEVALRFYDYWRSLPGAKGRKLDWSATWRNWVREERQERRSVSREPDNKFHVNGLDHSSTTAAMAASMEKHGIVVSDGDDPIEF